MRVGPGGEISNIEKKCSSNICTYVPLILSTLFRHPRSRARARARPNRKKKGISRSRSILSFPPRDPASPLSKKKKRLWRKLRDPRLSISLRIYLLRDGRPGGVFGGCLHCITLHFFFLFLSFFLIRDSIVENSKNVSVHPQKKNQSLVRTWNDYHQLSMLALSRIRENPSRPSFPLPTPTTPISYLYSTCTTCIHNIIHLSVARTRNRKSCSSRDKQEV